MGQGHGRIIRQRVETGLIPHAFGLRLTNNYDAYVAKVLSLANR